MPWGGGGTEKVFRNMKGKGYRNMNCKGKSNVFLLNFDMSNFREHKELHSFI